MNETIENVADFCTALGLTLTATQISARTDETYWDRNAYHFHVTILNGSRTMAIEYSQGAAHVDTKLTRNRSEYRVPRKPRIADVIDSLRSDAIGADQSFEGWCADLDYDSDSRRAERIYHACVRTRARLVQLLGREGFARLMRAEGL